MAVKGFVLEVKEDTCTGCGNCIVACPVNAVEPEDVMGIDKGSINVYEKDFCTGCGNCMVACAYDAIEVTAPKPVETAKFQKAKDVLYGRNNEIYELIKSKGPLMLTQIADEMGISAKEASLHVHALKNSDKVQEYEKIGRRYTYSTQKVEKEAEEVKEEFKSKTPPEVARKIKERIDAAIDSFNTLKVRVLVETDKLDKAKDELVKKGDLND